MKVSPLEDFICPLDGLSLTREYKTVKCAKGHEYDLSRKGYCNLLLVQDKSSLDPGDDKDMVAARRRFLDLGLFLPIAQRVFSIIRECTTKYARGKLFRVVDAGCGEGYYLHQIQEMAEACDDIVNLKLAGCDISKWAIKFASNRSTQIGWAVASNRQMPFTSGSVDMLVSMFGYPVWESFRKMQTNEGCLLIVDPGVDHLIELRKIIYPSVAKNVTTVKQAKVNNGYVCEKEDRLKFTVDLDKSAQIMDLLSMTPHAFRVMKERRDQLKKLNKLTVTIDVIFRLLRKDLPRKV